MEARNERLVMIRSIADSGPPMVSSYPMSFSAYEGDDENAHHRKMPAIDSIISSREVICAQAAGGFGEPSLEDSNLAYNRKKMISNQPSLNETPFIENQLEQSNVSEQREGPVRQVKHSSISAAHSTLDTMIDMGSADESALPPINFGLRGGRSHQPAAGLGAAVNEDEVPESGKVCRICLDEEAENPDGGFPEDPFITPCKCTGSMKFIHVNCIRGWLDGRKQRQKLDGVYSYYWEDLVCELCKDPLKLRNKVTWSSPAGVHVEKEYFLLNYKVPRYGRYMVIESDINCLSKAIHVVDFDFKQEYNVGRRVSNDITVSDISVSRAQASFVLRDGSVFVSDCASKFGTFVKL